MELSKRISKNRILQLAINRDYTRIGEIIEVGNTDFMSYDLCQSDDYGFYAMGTEDFEGERLIFSIDKNNPLYIPFLNLLNEDKSLIIDDDSTRELKQKYLEIVNEGDYISLSFINKDEDASCIDKFDVFIKNIAYDLRSKIDSQRLDTKSRLIRFFNEVRVNLQNDQEIGLKENPKVLSKVPNEKS